MCSSISEGGKEDSTSRTSEICDKAKQQCLSRLKKNWVLEKEEKLQWRFDHCGNNRGGKLSLSITSSTAISGILILFPYRKHPSRLLPSSSFFGYRHIQTTSPFSTLSPWPMKEKKVEAEEDLFSSLERKIPNFASPPQAMMKTSSNSSRTNHNKKSLIPKNKTSKTLAKSKGYQVFL